MTIPDINWSAPRKITKGGSYAFDCMNDKGGFAVEVDTGEPVDISGCRIAGNGESLLKLWGGTNVTARFNTFIPLAPLPGQIRPRACNNWGGKKFVFENNHMEDVGGGILVQDWQGTGPEGNIVIRYNYGRNCNRLTAEGTVGPHRAWVQFNQARNLKNSKIEWNDFKNEWDKSSIEDIINMFNSSGSKGDPIRIRNNYLYGAYPNNPATATEFSGSGVTVDGDPAGGSSMETISRWIDADGNVVLECCNALMNIATGNNCHFYDNIMLSTGMLPDGTRLKTSWAACCIFNSSHVPPERFFNNSIENNTIGFNSWGRNYPYPDRQDEQDVKDAQGNRTENFMPRGKNFYLPAGPVTRQKVEEQYAIWRKRCAENKIVIGLEKPEEGVGNPILKVGQVGVGSIKPVNTKGLPTPFKPGSVQATSGDPAIATMSVDPTDETKVIITPVKPGKVTGSVAFINTKGTVISKNFDVLIMAADTPGGDDDSVAVNFTIVFTIKS